MIQNPPGVLLSVAYDGTHFHGFAVQGERRTIASELLRALRALDPEIRYLRGSSRTDAGVHAMDQRVAFDPTLELPARAWSLGIKRHLPHDIAIRRAAFVPRGFVPRFHTQKKRYRYLLLADTMPDPLWAPRVWRLGDLRAPEALPRMIDEAGAAVGTHDFAAFRASSDVRINTVRTIFALRVEADPGDPRLVRVDVEGSGFLHHMVRILVGTLTDVARGRAPPGAVRRALESRCRIDAGLTAPAQGLCLLRTWMDQEGAGAHPSDGSPPHNPADSDPASDPTDSDPADSDPACSDPADGDLADGDPADGDPADGDLADGDPAESDAAS